MTILIVICHKGLFFKSLLYTCTMCSHDSFGSKYFENYNIFTWSADNFEIDKYVNNDYYLRNRKHVPCFYRVTETRVEVRENAKCCGNTSRTYAHSTILVESMVKWLVTHDD